MSLSIMLRRALALCVATATPTSATACHHDNPVALPSGPHPAAIRAEAIALDVGERVPLSYVVLDSAGQPMPGYPVTFVATRPSVAGVSSTGIVSGLAYGATAVTISADKVTQTAAVQVSPWPHQPVGFTVVTERDFSRLARSPQDTAGLSGWDAHEESQFQNLSITSDAGAPRSPPGVLQASYAAGTVGGSAAATPGRLEHYLTPASNAVYLSVWVRLSANWRAHATGTNKVLYVWINEQPRFFLSAEGKSSDALQPSGRLQGTPDDIQRRREVLPPNVDATSRVTPGTWQRWEVVLRANTPGARNGEFHLWMDGIEVARYTDVEYLAPGESQAWMMVDIEPIWGGLGDQLVAAQWMRFDHIYISAGL